MLHWLRKQLLVAGLDDAAVFKAEIASEEALVNIIEHAYKQRTGIIEIEICDGKAQNSFVAITIRDYGPPFNPLDCKIDFDPKAPLEERKIGGLGILFMREYMDEVRYRREGDVNTLVLIKHKAS